MSLLRGRFNGQEEDLLREFSSSLDVDLWIAEEDLEGSMAHVTMLGEVGVLPPAEAETLLEGLRRILQELRDGTWTPEGEEDIHMAVEARLTELVGDVGGKLHTARSRNDQVATAIRLWLKRRLDDLFGAIGDLIEVLVDRTEAQGDVLIPGYTHLQRGQPILIGHHLLAHSWSLARDLDRVAELRTRVDRSPLGAGAMAGTGHPIDVQRTSELLGFAKPFDNAMDAVAARDHLQEAVAVCAICMATVSRLAEELVLWTTAEVALVRLDDRHVTSSSIMPQKRNPDGAELVRGHSGIVFGHLQTMLTIGKGVPLAYNRDFQLERRPLFDSLRSTIASVRLLTGMWRGLEIQGDRFERELSGDPVLATELADCLVERGVPFREAHQAVAKAVRWCEEQRGDLGLLDDGVGRRFHDAFPTDLGPWLDPRAAAERRRSHGGTAPTEIARQVAELRTMLRRRL
jgi:argininosuccinate lyase